MTLTHPYMTHPTPPLCDPPHPTLPLHDPPHPWNIFGKNIPGFHGLLHYVSLLVDKNSLNFICHLSWLKKLSPAHTHPLISIREPLTAYELLLFELVIHKMFECELGKNSANNFICHLSQLEKLTPAHAPLHDPPHPFMAHPTPPLHDPPHYTPPHPTPPWYIFGHKAFFMGCFTMSPFW